MKTDKILKELLAVGLGAGISKKKCAEMMREVETRVRENLAEYLAV